MVNFLRNVGCGALVLASLALPLASASAQNSANADAVFNGWLQAYLIRSGGKTYFCNNLQDRSMAFLWGQAYMITAVEDAYDRSPTSANRQLVSDLLNTFEGQNTRDLSWDSWNDDVEWCSIALIRGYQITGNTAFRDAAAQAWDMTYNRGYSSDYGGGIWENQDSIPNGDKGGLSNWPQIIAGCMIYHSTNDAGYLTKCKSLYAWGRANCFDPNSGRVYEAYHRNGGTYGDDNSYNSGLLINAANALYKITGDSTYYNDAVKAADHCVAKFNGTSGVMTEDHPANGGFGCDQIARGLSKFARENNLWSKYYPFLQTNCTAAWNHRRTDYNTSGNNFNTQTSATQNWWGMEVEGSVVVQLVTQINAFMGTHTIVNVQNGEAVDNNNSLGSTSTQNAGVTLWAKNAAQPSGGTSRRTRTRPGTSSACAVRKRSTTPVPPPTAHRSSSTSATAITPTSAGGWTGRATAPSRSGTRPTASRSTARARAATTCRSSSGTGTAATNNAGTYSRASGEGRLPIAASLPLGQEPKPYTHTSKTIPLMNLRRNATTSRADADKPHNPAPAGRAATQIPKRNHIKQAKWAALGLASALAPMLAPSAQAFTSADADTLFNAFNNTFYNNVGQGGNYYYRVNTDTGNTGSGWWTYAEEIEMAEDAYDRTQSANTKNIVTALCNDFIYQYGKLWTANNYNDDICWATIVMARAYKITGNTTFKDVSKANFDAMYSRAWDTQYFGGGLFWNTDKFSKNACVNGPAAIAAWLIYQNGGDTWYRDRSNDIYNWEWHYLYDAAYGAVHDNININGTVSNYVASYNQGTFIGAADYLGHPNDATKTMDYSKTLWPNLLPDAPDGDLAGFNGIFMRWAAKYMKDSGQQSKYLSWLQANANAAFNVRRSDNLSWKNWDQATPGGKLDAWSCTNSVVALQVVPPDGAGGGTAASPIAGTHLIVNVQDGEAIDNASSAGSTTTQNVGVVLWAKNGGNSQKWTFSQNADTSWNIVSAYNNQALDDAGSAANGAQMIQYPANGGNNQRWWVDRQSDGTFKIWNKANSKSLDSAGKSGNNLPLIQWDWNGGNQQRWNLQ